MGGESALAWARARNSARAGIAARPAIIGKEHGHGMDMVVHVHAVFLYFAWRSTKMLASCCEEKMQEKMPMPLALVCVLKSN